MLSDFKGGRMDTNEVVIPENVKLRSGNDSHLRGVQLRSIQKCSIQLAKLWRNLLRNLYRRKKNVDLLLIIGTFERRNCKKPTVHEEKNHLLSR